MTTAPPSFNPTAELQSVTSNAHPPAPIAADHLLWNVMALPHGLIFFRRQSSSKITLNDSSLFSQASADVLSNHSLIQVF